MIDPSLLVDGVLRGVLGGRRKSSRKALRYLTGRGGGWLSNPNTLLTAAGVAWGIFDTLQQSGTTGSPGAPVPASGPAPVMPPLPNVGAAASVTLPADALRLIRLAISAAYADGAVSEQERAAIVQQVQASGGADLVAAELAQPRPLKEIVSGVTEHGERSTLYVLAYSIVRADSEPISGAERIYLAQLANLVGLAPADVQKLEKDAGDRIDAQS
jgi:uncharacterized membrane protein YebE (DUF533 family)